MSLFAAVDAHGITRYIGDVQRGAACGCFCPECKSPVVAKHGEDHVWHFAHEASQERPQCLPGSVNLLRSLAIDRLMAFDTLAMPVCKKVLSSMTYSADIFEVAEWNVPNGYLTQRFENAAFNQPVAIFGIGGFPACTIGLWVQIGDLAIEADHSLTAELVFFAPAPAKGEITTHASAVSFLQQNARWHWQRMPDVFGELERAAQTLKERITAHEAALAAKFQRVKDLQQANMAHRGTPPRGSVRWVSLDSLNDPTQRTGELPAPVRPSWSALQKQDTSLFAFKLVADNESWIVINSADHDGYYIVPGAGLVDGWDEALPRSIGTADIEKGAYKGDGPINNAILFVRGLGVQSSRIDSNAILIGIFTGWKEDAAG